MVSVLLGKLALLIFLNLNHVSCYRTSPLQSRTYTATYNNGPPPLPKACMWTESAQERNILCKMKSLTKADGILANLSLSNLNNLHALKLECSDTGMYESNLESSATPSGYFLAGFKQLQSLDIDSCKLRYVPALVFTGLSSLRSLVLRTRNTEWNLNLELHHDSFRGLTELKDLSLAENGLYEVPKEVFCPMYSLKTLNLSRNHLNDVKSLLFSDWGKGPSAPGKACNTGLETLDLSHNDINILPDNSFTALRSLTILNLQGNLLSEVADRSFVGLVSLQLLNMSNNKMIALPPELFQSTRKIRQIFLQNNSITVLAPGLLEGLDQLEVLDLSRNALSSEWINRDTFAGLIRLLDLNLSNNKISRIDRQVFRGLYSLQQLDLGQNLIEKLSDNSFTDLKNLNSLILSNNRLKQINHFDFSELYVLKLLWLDSNYITDIHEQAFENLTHLHDLGLNDNKLESIPSNMKSLRFLKSLDLGKNQISDITVDAFEGLEELLGLRLTDNLIGNISRDTFSALPSLRVLNLASNKIRHIDQSAFISNPSITGIRLDNNLLEDISGVFTSLSTLIWLNVSDNKLIMFDYSHFPDSLQWLDIHLNEIEELGNYFNIQTGVSIKMLDVSYNRITKLNAKSIPDNIENFFINNNLIDDIEPGTFLQKTNLTKVILSGNLLQHLEMSALTLPVVQETRNIPEFYLANNLFHCDCKLEWLHRINELSYLRQYPKVNDIDEIKCTLEHTRGTHERLLLELNNEDFLCKYDQHCFALCHCCDFDACDCKMTCPTGCTCYHDPAWNTNIVDCGNANLKEVPKKIPMDVTDLYLDGNNFENLPSHQFIGKKKLQRLYLNNSLIETLENKVFNGLTNLVSLHLEDNAITEVRQNDFNQFQNLLELHMNDNSIKRIPEGFFTRMNNLQILNLQNNKIQEFKPWNELATVENSLKNLNLKGTQLACDCTNDKMKHWYEQWNKNDEDLFCANKKPLSVVVSSCETNAIKSPGPVATPTVQRTLIPDISMFPNGYMPLFIAVIIGVVLTLLIIILAFTFRNDFRLWAYSRYGVRLRKDPLTALEKCEDNEKLYDAYVIYGADDSDSIQREFTSELEHMGYSLCLHYRDLHAQNNYLVDTLQSATDASRKIIIFLSINFLRTEWSHPEFHSALQSVLELVRPSRRQHKIILITTCPDNVIMMDPILDVLLRTCTVINWDDRRFWDKLRFAMPDLSAQITGGHHKHHNSNKNVIKAQNLRYGPTPTIQGTWCQRQNQPPSIQLSSHISPSNSNCPTEDELSSTASSQHYESPTHHRPYAYDTGRRTANHVYSTIPEGQYPPVAPQYHINTNRSQSRQSNRPCFV
uniref:CSON001803 protein n=1 Tax=Culicoides sonorensis TaxID=179676 RepID=A0A336LW85_CULSO